MTSTDEFRPSHVGICVNDLDRSLQFYRDGLGCTVGDRFDIASADVPGIRGALEANTEVSMTSQFINLGSQRIELIGYEFPDPTGSASSTRLQPGLTHLAVVVDNLDTAAARLVEHGGTIIESTRQNVGISVVMVEAPEGTRVELMCYG